MTAFDLSDLLTIYRAGAAAILSPKGGILGQVSSARLNLDLLGVTLPHAVKEQVTAGPAMPPPDSTDPAAEDKDLPWTEPPQGENCKFTHPDKLLALVAAFQFLQGKMGEDITFTGHDGKAVTMPAGSALAAIL